MKKNKPALPDKNHVSRRECARINELTAPLKDLFGVLSFTYQRVYYSGSIISFTSHKDWNEYFWENNLHGIADGLPFLGVSNVVIDPYIAPNSPYGEKIIKPAKELFGFYHYILLLKHHLTYSELCIFAFSQENTEFYRMVKDFLPLVNKFIFYFKNEAKDLIDEHEQHHIPWGVKPGTRVKYSVDSNMYNQYKISQFMKKTDTSRYYLEGDFKDSYLTPRELSCLRLIAKNLTAKQMAKELFVSARSIEKYLNILKEKLNCANKKELIYAANKILETQDLDSKDDFNLTTNLDAMDPERAKLIKDILGCELSEISFFKD